MSIRYSARNSAGEVVEIRRYDRGAWGKPSSDLVVTHGPAGDPSLMMKVAIESRAVAMDLARALTELAAELPDDTGNAERIRAEQTLLAKHAAMTPEQRDKLHEDVKASIASIENGGKLLTVAEARASVGGHSSTAMDPALEEDDCG